jgi:hypothetical protein
MANDVRIRFRSFLPGAGFDSAGGPAQGKTRTVGTVTVTSLDQNGEALTAVDLGLVTLDSLSLRVSEETSSAAGQTKREAIYSPSAAQFYLNTVSSVGVVASYVPAATETLEFVAEGDSAASPELL